MTLPPPRSSPTRTVYSLASIFDRVTHAADSHHGVEVLRCEVGSVGLGQDDAAAAAVLSHEDRVLVGVDLRSCDARGRFPPRSGSPALRSRIRWARAG